MRLAGCTFSGLPVPRSAASPRAQLQPLPPNSEKRHDRGSGYTSSIPHKSGRCVGPSDGHHRESPERGPEPMRKGERLQAAQGYVWDDAGEHRPDRKENAIYDCRNNGLKLSP